MSEPWQRTSKESVEFHEQLEVDIVTLGRLAVGVPDVMAVQVDTCRIIVSILIASDLTELTHGRGMLR